MMKILLTGASGFIGEALASRLAASGAEVHVVARQQSITTSLTSATIIHRHDGTTEGLCEILEKSRPDIVVHMASLFLADHTIQQVSGLIESNVLFGCQLLEAMRRAHVLRLINTGTCWQHYETDDVRPVNLYAATKQAFDTLVDYYHDAWDISQITLKLCDTYGPNDKRRKLINILLQAAASDERLDMSPGDQILDLTHINDIVSAYERAITLLGSTEKKTSARYLISGSRHSLKEVVAMVSRVTGRDLQANFGGRPYRDREVMNPSYGAEPALPGWAPMVDLETGLSLMLAAAQQAKGTPHVR